MCCSFVRVIAWLLMIASNVPSIGTCRRDLIAMTSTVDDSMVSKHIELFTNLLKVLEVQVMTMEQDFFEVRTCVS